jgi:hypothetical protein
LSLIVDLSPAHHIAVGVVLHLDNVSDKLASASRSLRVSVDGELTVFLTAVLNGRLVGVLAVEGGLLTHLVCSRTSEVHPVTRVAAAHVVVQPIGIECTEGVIIDSTI